MGLSLSISVAIISVGILLAFITHYPVVTGEQEELRLAEETEHDIMMKELKSSVEIHDKDGNVVTELDPAEKYYLYNSGEYTTEISKIVVLVDGEYYAGDIFKGSDEWLYPGDKVQIKKSFLKDNDESQLKIVTEHGASVSVYIEEK